jgi:hypothetical protein
MKKTRIAITGASLFVTLICWALSSPINSHEDERYNIGTIYCANGYNEHCKPLGIDNYGNRVALFQSEMCIPPGIEETYKRILIDRTIQGCQYESKGNQPWGEFSISPNIDYATQKYIATNINTSHTPTGYYKFMSIFITNDLTASVLIMRIINSAIFCLFLVMALAISNLGLTQSVLSSVLCILIPNGLFISSGITTSSWSYIGCTFSWVFVYALLNNKPNVSLKSAATIIGLIAAGAIVFLSRYDAILYVIFSNFIVITLKLKPFAINSKKVLLLQVPLVALILYLRSEIPVIKSLTSLDISQRFSTFELTLFLGNSIKLAIAVPLRIIGLEPVGWFDDLGPPTYVFFTHLILLAFFLRRIHETKNKVQNLLSLVFLFFYLSICFTQVYKNPDWSTPFYYIRTGWRGDSFQSRYWLPIVSFFVGMMMLHMKNLKSLFDQNNFRLMIVTVLSFTHWGSLYSVGKIFRENPTWYWLNFPLGINSIFIVGVTSFFIFLLTTTLIITDAPKSRNMTSWLRIKNGGRGGI